MKRRTLLQSSAAAALLASCRSVNTDTSAIQVPPRTGPAPTRVLMIGWDGVYTPAMRDGTLDMPGYDRMRALGTRCTEAIATVPLCAPTRGAWLSGLPPQSNAQIGNNYRLDASIPSLVQSFSDQGFACELYGKQHTNNAEDGSLLWGYSRWLNRNSPDFQQVFRAHKVQGAQAYVDRADQALFDEIHALTGVNFGGRVSEPSLDPDWTLTQEALLAVDRLESSGQPWLVNLSLLGPHHPYRCPEEFWYALDPEQLAEQEWERESYLQSAMGRRLHEQRNWQALGPQHRGLIRARQLGYLMYMDWLLQGVLDHLQDAGLLESTLILLQSDHGVLAGDHGLFLKTDFFVPASRITSVLSYPGLVPAGVDYPGSMSSMDLLPTLLGLCDLPVPSGVVGESVSDAIRAQAPSLGPAYSVGFLSYNTQGEPQARMIQKGPFKACFYNPGAFSQEAPPAQLYDLERDPGELQNLAADPDYADLLDNLKAKLLATEATFPSALAQPVRV